MDLVGEILILHRWLKQKNYNYYSINSLPNMKLADSLIRKNKILGVMWRQLFRLSPVNFRPIFDNRPDKKNPKAMILLSWAYLELWSCCKRKEFKESFENCIEEVISTRSSLTKNFAVPQLNRIFMKSYQANGQDVSPLLSAWVGFLFLRTYEYLEDDYYLALAESVGKYFIEEHPKIADGKHIYFYYAPDLSEKIYNVSAVVSSFLMCLSNSTKDPKVFEYGKKGIEYIISLQNQDGSWFYGEKKEFKYIDNFHTAFVLLALFESMRYWSNRRLLESFHLGLQYYSQNLFEQESERPIRPIHFDSKFLPGNSNIIQRVDIRDSALSIILFSVLSKDNMRYLEYCKSIYDWTLENIKGKETFFAETTWLWKNRIPYIELQSWMLLSLSIYLKYYKV